jgi:Family of unknown function (DUF6188)
VTALELTRRGDGWMLPVAGQLVTRVCLDNEEIGVLCLNQIEISISEPFVLTGRDGVRHLLDPAAGGPGLAPVLRIMRQVISAGTAFDDGRLEISFDGGDSIRVPCGPDFEAWTIAGPGGPDGLKIVSLPGGELAIWDDSRT